MNARNTPVLRLNVAIIWPEFAGASMLEYVVLKCRDRFAGAYWGNHVAICCVKMLQLFGLRFTQNNMQRKTLVKEV